MDQLERRVRNLERQNRALIVLLGGVSFIAVAGFRSAQVSDLVRAKKVEIVDDRGVPFVTLGLSRQGGGEVVLRDETGDRRAWLSTGNGTARLGMISGTEDSPSASVGLAVEPALAHMALSGGKASAVSEVVDEQPSMELNGRDGKRLFQAPWHGR
jgi:hypothetical protein